MKKAELVAKIAEDAGLTKVQAQKALNSFITATTAALKAGDKISLIGFGTFSAVKRAARKGRNPRTGKEIKIAAKTHGKFTAGKKPQGSESSAGQSRTEGKGCRGKETAANMRQIEKCGYQTLPHFF